MRGSGWLSTHLKEFVEPYLGCIPDADPIPPFNRNEMAVIKNVWRAMKSFAKGKRLVLPGRDVYIFEVLARRENYPTLFLPECSRSTVGEIYKRGLVPQNSPLFDTGFAGSIPTILKTPNFKLISHCMRGSGDQIFPHLTRSRGLALKIETLPKYWERARMGVAEFGATSDEIVQGLSPKEEFLRAAQVTIAIYKDSSPAFINESTPLGIRRELWKKMWS